MDGAMSAKRQICMLLSEEIIEMLRRLKLELSRQGWKRIREGGVTELIVRYLIENRLVEPFLTWARGKLAAAGGQ